MNNNELIIKLISMLGNQNSNSESLLPWQKQIISRATELDSIAILTNPTKDELVKFAKSLSPIDIIGDIDKAEYFCFLPVAKKKWKVFLVDKFNNVIARMEDYEDAIIDITQPIAPNQPQPLYLEVFLLKIS